jgi:hypothetical protein
MTARAVILGSSWALFICGFTYYNNQFLGQTFFVANHLPTGVFGVLLVLWLFNALWRRLRPGHELAPGELAVMVTLALAICSWPYSNGFRLFTTALAYPNHMYKLEAGWQGVRALSYVPGGSPLLAEGFITDFEALQTELAPGTERASGLARSVAERVPASARRELASYPKPLGPSERRQLLAVLNQLLEGPDLLPLADGAGTSSSELERLRSERAARAHELAELRAAPAPTSGNAARLLPLHLEQAEHQLQQLGPRLNREVVRLAWPRLIAPALAGSGVILADGYDDPLAVRPLITGWSGARLGLLELPWRVWWPTLRLWGSFAVLLVWAMLCQALIVHPQWTERELLPYPIVAFLRNLLEVRASGVPELFHHRTFWGGLGAACALNTINGLHAWFSWVPEIPRGMDFSPLRDLFPRISQVGWTTFLAFNFTLYPIVIAFTYFIRGDVGLSLGLANIAWIVLGSFLIGAGIDLNDPVSGASAEEMLRIGATIGFACVILYAGRRYYLNVAAAALGFTRHSDTPRYSVWAARALVVCSLLMLWLLQSWAGLHWIFSAIMVGGILISVLVMARINAEGGVFFFMPGHSPLSLLQVVFGFRAIAPSQYFTLSLLNTTFWLDPRGAALPYFSTGLHASDSIAKVSPRRSGGWLGLWALLGFLVCLAVTFSLQYNLGVGTHDLWPRDAFSRISFDNLTRQLSALSQQGDLLGSSSRELFALARSEPNRAMLGFVLLGFVAVLSFGLLRLRVPSWPLHPILLCALSSWTACVLAPSILLGWCVRGAVIQLAGSRGYRALRPLMTGVIAGELVSAIAWIGVGAAYYACTGRPPSKFSIFMD